MVHDVRRSAPRAPHAPGRPCPHPPPTPSSPPGAESPYRPRTRPPCRPPTGVGRPSRAAHNPPLFRTPTYASAGTTPSQPRAASCSFGAASTVTGRGAGARHLAAVEPRRVARASCPGATELSNRGDARAPGGRRRKARGQQRHGRIPAALRVTRVGQFRQAVGHVQRGRRESPGMPDAHPPHPPDPTPTDQPPWPSPEPATTFRLAETANPFPFHRVVTTSFCHARRNHVSRPRRPDRPRPP